jgi:hypothetical protein
MNVCMRCSYLPPNFFVWRFCLSVPYIFMQTSVNVQYLCECKYVYIMCEPAFECFRVWTGFCPRFEFMFLCVYVCNYLCMYAGMFLCTQIRVNFLHIFNSALHTHEYIQTQCVCISSLNIHRSRYASKKDAIRHKSRNESTI